MPVIKTTIDIAASPEMVWRVLTDFPSYPKWNPFIRSVQGKPVQGQRLKIGMRLPHGRPRRFSARVVKAIPATELRWRGKMLIAGLFDGEHAFIIVPNGLKGVRFIQREHFSGLLTPLILSFIGAKTHKGFDLMNIALKKAAEAKSQ